MKGDTFAIEAIEIQESYFVYTKKADEIRRVYTTPRKKLDRILYEDGRVFVFKDMPNVYTKVDPQKIEVDSSLSLGFGFFIPSVKYLDRTLTNAQVKSVLLNKCPPWIYHEYIRGKRNIVVANLFGAVAGFFLGREIGIYFNSNVENNAVVFSSSALASIVSLTLVSKGKGRMQYALDYYNDVMYRKEEMSFEFKIENGKLKYVYSF
jgi:hypothetical protein